MIKFLKTTLLLSVLTLAGCATVQQQVYIEETFWETPKMKVGIAMSEIPKPDLYVPGAHCLLCLAAATAANSSLNTYSKTLDTSDLSDLKQQIADTLKAKGIESVVVEQAIKVSKLKKLKKKSKGKNPVKKNFAPVVDDKSITHLIVIDLYTMGMSRPYSAYVPTGEPQGFVNAAAYIVDLNTNTYAQYKAISSYQSTEGEWDEAPAFPALTNAYYRAIAMAKDQIINIYK